MQKWLELAQDSEEPGKLREVPIYLLLLPFRLTTLGILLLLEKVDDGRDPILVAIVTK